MEDYRIWIVIGGIVILFLILKYVLKKVTALIIVGLAIISLGSGMYILNIGPFKQSINVYELYNQFCDEENDNKCECIVNPMVVDFETRISEEKREAINNDKIKSFMEVSKSFKNILPKAKNCLLQRGAESEMTDFISEVFEIDMSTFTVDQIKNDLDSLMVK